MINSGASTDQGSWKVDVSVRLLKARDLSVKQLEVTQVLQDDANSIPLVQGRRTVVRAFLDIGTDPGPVKGVSGVLEGYAGATKLGTVYPFNPDMKIDAPSHPNWKNINDTLNFELPIEWTLQPALTLKVEVNRNRSVVESNYDNNQKSAGVSLRACTGISIGYTPIHYAPPAGAAADPGAGIAAGQVFMQKIYPLSENGLVYVPLGAMTFMQDINAKDVDTSLLESLEQLLLISSPPRPEHIFGWLPSLAYTDNGLGYMNGDAAFGNDTESPDRWRRTFAHEIGHNLNLVHPKTNIWTEGDHWFDVYDRVIKPVPPSTGGGDQLLDFMVPERLEPEAWINPYNIPYIMDKLCPAAGAAANAPGLTQVGDNLIVTGTIANATPAAGTLNPLLRLSTVPATVAPTGSQYCVNLKDASGSRLGAYCFNPDFNDDSGTPVSAAPFSMAVPYPAGLQRVELTQTSSAAVLSTRLASAHAPTVTLTFPNASGLTLSGTQAITWTGSDADANPLTYSLLYSHDNGATWQGVATNLTGTTCPLDFSTLPGGTGAAGLIRVLASDGFYTAQDTSDNPFTVGNKPPSALILSPSSGASFTAGPKIVLQGAGPDLEDGSLTGSALVWSSSKDGPLGSGRLLEATLSTGLHTLTLTLTDTKGLTAAAHIQLTVIQGAPQHTLFLPLVTRR